MNQALRKSVFDRVVAGLRSNPVVIFLPPVSVAVPVIADASRFVDEWGKFCVLVGRDVSKEFDDFCMTVARNRMDTLQFCIFYFRRFGALPWEKGQLHDRKD